MYKNIVATTLCLAALALAQTDGEIPAVFREPRQGSRTVRPIHQSLRRYRETGVNMRLFDRAAAKRFRSGLPGARRSVRMNLFPEVDLIVNWNKTAPVERSNDVVWTGAVEGDPLSQVILIVSDTEMTGNIATAGKTYQIRPGDGGHWIGEADPASAPPEGEPLKSPDGPPAEPVATADAAAADEPTVIDVMIVYTPAVRQAAGGPDRILQQIQLGIAETNEGYANSRLNHRVRLVGYGEVDYRESGSFQTDLNRLSGNGDGYLDQLHALRDRVGADIVSLWVETGDYCGLGWLLNPFRPNTEYGFNVVMRTCATSEYVLGHEIGHNLGAAHAPDDPNNGGAYTFSFGFKQRARTPYFRTIMAYRCPANDCPRFNIYSSPDLTVQGIPAGTKAQNDNRSTLYNTAAIVAGFRTSTQPAGGTAPPPASETLPESSHPYADRFDRTWSYTAAGNPASIMVTFDPETHVEAGWDFIVIMDGNGREVSGSPFTGNQLSNKYVIVPGSTVRIRLVSDESINGYGFKVVNVRAASGGGVDLATVSFTASNTGTLGGTIEGLAAKVQNMGQAGAGAFRIAFYWIDGNSEAVFSGWSCALSSLGPGSSYTCSGDIGVASSLRPGQYRLVAIADDEKKTADTDWDNNARASEGGVVTIH